MVDPDVPRVLDAKQLKRIEKVHGGFLYQHLFSAACIVAMSENGCDHVTVENDEDVELAFAEQRVYIQVKMRAHELKSSDLRGFMDRVSSVRAAHRSGARSGRATFVIASNVAPASALNKRMRRPDWPSDVAVVWPESEAISLLPLPQRSILEFVSYLASDIRRIPYRAVAAETLALKLAGLVQLAASGTIGHTFTRDGLSELLDQIILAVQRMPVPPVRYYPHDQEPEPATAEKRRLVTGLPGAGKTAWAAQAASYRGASTAYFDVGDTPMTLVGSSLAREVVGQLFSPQSDAFARILGGVGSGDDAVRRLVAAIRDIPDVTVVIDNVHNLDDETLHGLSSVLGDVTTVLLARPWQGATVVAARLELEPEHLKGWNEDTIAQFLADEGMQSHAASVSAVKLLTGGLPLFVKALARLARSSYNGDVAATCRALEAGASLNVSAQEVILDRVVESLSTEGHKALAVLGYASIRLSSDEAVSLLSATGILHPIEALRGLLADAIAQFDRNNTVRLHEAFRLHAQSAQRVLSENDHHSLRTALLVILESTLSTYASADRVQRWIDFITAGDDSLELVNAATDDHLLELGDAERLFDRVYRIAENENEPVVTRYAALDALTSRALRQGRKKRAERLFTRMQAIYKELPTRGPRELSTLVSKQMLVLSAKGDVPGMREAYNATIRDIVSDDVSARVVLFNYAVALFNAKAYELALNVAQRSVARYMALLVINEDSLLTRRIIDVIADIPDSVRSATNLKRFADAYSLMCAAGVETGVDAYWFGRFVAYHFYFAAGADRSAVEVGLQLAADSELHDGPAYALRFVEDFVLPLALHSEKASDLRLPVRDLHARLLVTAGEIQKGVAQAARLRAYGDSRATSDIEASVSDGPGEGRGAVKDDK